MPIRTQSSDGVTHEFPDDTTPEVVDKVMKGYADEHKDKSTTLGQMGSGAMDPIEGGAQLLENVLPGAVTRPINKFNNVLAGFGLTKELPVEGAMNEHARQREAEIQKTRGDNTGLDWSRMAGNILSPANYIGGGLIGPAAKGASAVARVGTNVARAASAGAVSGAEQPATEPDYWHEKGLQIGVGGVAGGAIGATGSAASSVISKLGEFIARRNPENLNSQAVNKVLRRITQDTKSGGPGATDILDLVNASSKPAVMADEAGANVKALAGNVARQPGPARQVAENFLTKRDEGAAQRLSEDINKYVSGGPTMYQATEALLQARSAAAKPAYQAAHDLEGIWSPRLDQFLQEPVVKTGLQRGFEIERLQALAEGRPLTAHQMGVDIGVDGSIALVDKPNMRLLDMGKQGLDAMIADERNEITGRLSARGVALNNVRKAYVTTIDDLDKTGAYKKARASWAGHSESLDSIRVGRTALQRSPEENAALLAETSPANREFYRLGLADLLKERLAKTGLSADEAKQLIKNPWTREQLRPAFKSGAEFDAFVDAVTTESKMFGTRGEAKLGSATAGRAAEDASADSHWSDAAGVGVGRLLTGHGLVSAAKAVYQRLLDTGMKPNPELNEKIAQILFSTALPKETEEALRKGAQIPIEGSLGGAAAATEGAALGLAPAVAVDATKQRVTGAERP